MILSEQQLHVLIALHHGVLGFLQIEVQESVPCLRLDVALALFPLAPLVDQAVQVVLLDGFPAAVQGVDGKFMLRVRLGAQGDEPVIGLGLAAGILAPIPLPIVHRFQPPGDLLPLLGGIVIQRSAGLPLRQRPLREQGHRESRLQLIEILLLEVRLQGADGEHPFRGAVSVDPLLAPHLFSLRQFPHPPGAASFQVSHFFRRQYGFHRRTPLS